MTRLRALAWAWCALAACGAPPPAKKPVAPRPSAAPSASAASSTSAALDPRFREREPPLGPASPIPMPRVGETRLANGMRMLVANTGGGMFAMGLVFPGWAAVPAERPAAVRVMVDALFGGTTTEDAHALRRVFEKRFARWSLTVTPDAVSIDLTMPDDDVAPCIDTLADVLENPVFDAQTLAFEELQLREYGQTSRESPEIVGRRVLARVLFGDGHPYAQTSTVLDGKKKVERAEVRRIYGELLDPANATVVLAGSTERALVDHVARSLGSWRTSNHVSPAAPPRVTWSTGPRLVVVDRPGAVQSEVLFGGLAPERSSPDFYAMTLVNELLGAHRASRLRRDLGERGAASYAGATHYDAQRSGGDFYWRSSVPLARTASALTELDGAFRALGQAAPPVAELEGWKETYVRHLPLEAETARATAGEIAELAVDGLPLDALDQLEPHVRAVTPDAVRALAAARLAPDKTRAVVVGDWTKLEADLKALGWGAIELRDPDGKVLRTVR